MMSPEEEAEMDAYVESKQSATVEKEQVNDMYYSNTKVDTTTLDHIKNREGVVYKSYKDSLGKLTAGVGHLLTKEEQKKYPNGTKIPKKQVDKWLQEDSKKAYKAAMEQMKDLNVTTPEFLTALTSVNFQLGTNWKNKFPTAYEHLKNKEYDRAIAEILYVKEGSSTKSKWNTQTPVRVNDFVDAIRNLK